MWIMKKSVNDLWGHPVTLLYAVIVGAGGCLTTSKAKPKGCRKTQNRKSTLDVRFRLQHFVPVPFESFVKFELAREYS